VWDLDLKIHCCRYKISGRIYECDLLFGNHRSGVEVRHVTPSCNIFKSSFYFICIVWARRQALIYVSYRYGVDTCSTRIISVLLTLYAPTFLSWLYSINIRIIHQSHCPQILRDSSVVLAQRNIDGQISTGCEENLQLGRAWLRNCLTNHPSCGPRQHELWLPIRLLDVGCCLKPPLRCQQKLCSQFGEPCGVPRKYTYD